MTEQSINWTEEDSLIYQRLAAVAVPDREEQLATIAALLPYDAGATFSVAELGSGEGYLSEVILSCFPNATVLALDGSEEMRETAATRLQQFGARFRVESFDIEDLGWTGNLTGFNAVVSSLCVHHLDGAGKQQMFSALAGAIQPGGALVIADLVAARHPVAHHYLGSTWDHAVLERADKLGQPDGRDAFEQEKWNIYWWPDEMDRPSTLAEQLVWLSNAGFDPVDCFWLQGAHAIYGGYLPGGAAPADLIGFERALAVSRKVLGTDLS